MNSKKIKLNGIIFVGVIIIVSFFYAVNIQPVVIGDSVFIKTYTELNNFNSYYKLADFLKNKSNVSFYWYFTSDKRFELGIINGINVKNKIALDSENDENIDYSLNNIKVNVISDLYIVKIDNKYIKIISNSKNII